MNQLLRLGAGLFLAITLAGCCYSPGYYDPVSGVSYGGGLEPCPLPDPLGLFGCPHCGMPRGWWGPSPGWTAPGCCNICGNAVSGCYHDNVTSGCCPTPYGADSSLPTVPADVYEGTIDPVPNGVYEETINPVPNGTTSPPEYSVPSPAASTTSAVPHRIYGRPARLPFNTALPAQDAPASRWLPARY